jgi:deazaflavin-dependent oxidoreductase (nitroreductase family)
LVPGYGILETTGRKTGRRRRTVVGLLIDDSAVWVVSEHGRHSGYVRNLEAHPEVRVRFRARWSAGVAHVVESDDPTARLALFGRPRHARIVQRFGTSLLSVRIDLAQSR